MKYRIIKMKNSNRKSDVQMDIEKTNILENV